VVVIRPIGPIGPIRHIDIRQNKDVTALNYAEFAPAPDLAKYVQSIWFRHVSAAEAEQPARVVPDGCMDLICTDTGTVVAGPDKHAWTGPLASGVEIVGLRFRPGMAPPLLGVPAMELVDARTALEDVSASWAADLNQRIPSDASSRAIGNALQASLRSRVQRAAEVDRATQYVAEVIQRAGDEHQPRVDELADAIGLSERQLLRRCQGAFGYGPKFLARIVRFQRFLTLATAPKRQHMAQLAADCGYADQAHLTREVKELSGLPPSELLAERARL
jgi:AraC-like DNA-binding protein